MVCNYNEAKLTDLGLCLMKDCLNKFKNKFNLRATMPLGKNTREKELLFVWLVVGTDISTGSLI